MKKLVATVFVLCCVATSSAQAAIECLSAPKSESGWWAWREIDGRKCWYKKVGAVPPKSDFVWPEHAKDAPPAKEAPPAREAPRPSSSPPPTTEGMRSPPPRIETARVKPVELTNPIYRLGSGRVGLTEGFSLSSTRGIGGAWEVPDHIVFPHDPFDLRYGRW